MDISEIILYLTKGLGWLGGVGLLGWVIRYSVTFTNARLIERKLQRQELQYLHNLLAFILLAILVPFIYSYGLTVVFQKLASKDNETRLLVVLCIFSILQILNSLIVLFVTGSSRERLKTISKFISKHIIWSRYISIIIALFSSFTWFVFMITYHKNNDIEISEDVISNAIIIYVALYIPYYIGLLKKINKEVLVYIYLLNDKVLTNLLLSHRTFGKDLIFFEIEDTLRLRPILVNKDNIEMILSVEYSTNSEATAPKKEMKEFSLRIVDPDLHKEVPTQSKKKRQKKK